MADNIAKTLFSQITSARDEAKKAGLITENIFNDRLNHMFVAGYLIGYVDSCLIDLPDINNKKEHSKAIFEKMFPGSGFDFVRAKLVARQQASTISEESEKYIQVKANAYAFDQGMELAQEEVEKQRADGSSQPVGLKEFLLLGEVNG